MTEKVRRLSIWCGHFAVQVLAIPLVMGVMALHLAHPFLHSFEGGSLDAMLPNLDFLAASLGWSRAVDFARGWHHRRHCHHEVMD